MTVASIRIPLTEGNVRYAHFYLRSCRHRLPLPAIGGVNRKLAGEPIRVTFQHGASVDTDIDGSKMILRNRAAVRQFFDATGAKGGDTVLIDIAGPFDWRVSLA